MAGTSLEKRSGAGEPDDAHGAEVATVAHGEVVSYNPDAPSEEWGWHGSWSDMAPRGSRALLWLGVIGMLLMVWSGNHESQTENWWMISIAGLMAIWLVAREVQIRKERARRP